jgi:hypothetical protein
MNRGKRWLLGVLGMIVLVFGLLCLNYTRADGLEHHQEAARRYGLLPPSNAILYGGVLAVVIGAATIGYSLGAGKRANS